VAPEESKKSAFSSTLGRLKKELTSGRLDLQGGDDKQEIKLPAKGDASAMSSSQLDDDELETLAQLSLGMLEGKARDNSSTTALENRKKSVTVPQSMLVFSSNAGFASTVSMSTGINASTNMLNLAHLSMTGGKSQASSSHSTSSGKTVLSLVEVTETTEPAPASAYATPRRPSTQQQQQPQASAEKSTVQQQPLHAPLHLPPLSAAHPPAAGGDGAQSGPAIV
jgi:hypothetical protein